MVFVTIETELKQDIILTKEMIVGIDQKMSNMKRNRSVSRWYVVERKYGSLLEI